MKKINKIFGYLLDFGIAIVVIIVIILLYGKFQTSILKKEYASLFGYTMFQVATGSMSGTIEIDDIVITKILSKEEELQKNDIIVFNQNDNIITHRLIEIGENFLVTKGDANNAKDEPIQREDVIGRVIKIIPNIAIWKKVFMSEEVYVPIVITIVLFGIACNISDDKKEIENNEGKNNE